MYTLAKILSITVAQMVYLLRLDLRMKGVHLQCATILCMVAVRTGTAFHKEMIMRDVLLC